MRYIWLAMACGDSSAVITIVAFVWDASGYWKRKPPPSGAVSVGVGLPNDTDCGGGSPGRRLTEPSVGPAGAAK